MSAPLKAFSVLYAIKMQINILTRGEKLHKKYFAAFSGLGKGFGIKLDNVRSQAGTNEKNSK